MERKAIKNIKKGDFMKPSTSPNAKVYTRGDYNGSTKKYEMISVDDINTVIYRKGDFEMYVGFEY